VSDSEFDEQLPDELRRLADALRNERAVPDGHLLERVLHAVGPMPARRRRGRWLLSPRLAMMGALAAVCLLGAKLTHVSVSGTATVLAGSVSSGTSGSNTGSAAGQVYCGSGSGSGSTDWAPSFRWHFGNVPGADDGWSPSVQPSCPSGALTIAFTDGSLSLAPGSTLYAGYDFHAASKPAFTLSTSGPSVTFSPIRCSNGSTPTRSSLTLAIPNGTYSSPANTPDWIPTGTKTDASGFQGSFIVANVCHGANVVISGGTFTSGVIIH
jgi:hypothetical protein